MIFRSACTRFSLSEHKETQPVALCAAGWLDKLVSAGEESGKRGLAQLESTCFASRGRRFDPVIPTTFDELRQMGAAD